MKEAHDRVRSIYNAHRFSLSTIKALWILLSLFSFALASTLETPKPLSFTMPFNTPNGYELLILSDNTFHAVRNALSSLFQPLFPRSMDRVLAEFNKLPSFTDYLPPVCLSIFVLSIPFILNYAATWLFFHTRHWSKAAARDPPTIPHMIPFIGSSLDLGFNALNFIKSST